MKKIIDTRIDQVQPGTLAGGDVLDLGGNLLIKAGSTLSAALLDKLKSRGVTTVPMLHEIFLSPEEIRSRTTDIEERLARRFFAVSTEPLMQQLKEQLRKFRIGGISD